jgi:uncharacterized membrane protein SpoIIM required for sporulation
LFAGTPSFIGIATILFTVVLTLPHLQRLFEKQTEKGSFFERHKLLLDFFIYFFIGSFIVFFLISLVLPSKVLSADALYGTTTSILVPEQGSIPQINQNYLTFEIFKNNFYVVIISFFLSLLYGSGILFLLILNASIFASTLSTVMRATVTSGSFLQTFAVMSCNMGIMFFHMIPEIVSYFLAAIAGGLLSVFVLRKKILSLDFLKTLGHSSLILLLAVFALFVSAVIEVRISRNLFLSGVCLRNMFGVLAAVCILVIVTVVLEFRRKRIQ